MRRSVFFALQLLGAVLPVHHGYHSFLRRCGSQHVPAPSRAQWTGWLVVSRCELRHRLDAAPGLHSSQPKLAAVSGTGSELETYPDMPWTHTERTQNFLICKITARQQHYAIPSELSGPHRERAFFANKHIHTTRGDDGGAPDAPNYASARCPRTNRAVRITFRWRSRVMPDDSASSSRRPSAASWSRRRA